MDQCFSRTLIQIFPYPTNVPRMEFGELALLADMIIIG